MDDAEQDDDWERVHRMASAARPAAAPSRYL